MECELRVRTRASKASTRSAPGARIEAISNAPSGTPTVDVGEKLKRPSFDGETATGWPGVEAKRRNGWSELNAARKVGARAASAGTGSHSQCARPFARVKKPINARRSAGARVAGAAADM